MSYYVKGYPRLAAFMGMDQDLGIFRRFDDLNFISLLALQDEIMELEQELRQQWQRVGESAANPRNIIGTSDYPRQRTTYNT